MGYTGNETFLEKADLALSDLTEGGGILTEAHAMKFLKLLIKRSVLMKMATVKTMSSPKQVINKIKFADRILRPGQESTALTKDERSKPDFSQVELDAKLFKGEVRLSDEALEDNLERGQFRQTIMEMMAEAVARDMEEIVIRGDKSSSDPFLAVFDGILMQAGSVIVDAGDTPTSKDVFSDLLRSLPSENVRDKSALCFLTSVDSDLDYRNQLAERATAIGDKFLEGDKPVLYSGIPVRAIPLFPEDLGEARDQTAILLCDPKNIHVGIWRKIRMEMARDVSEGVLKIVVTVRFDVKLAEAEGVAKAINVALS